MNWQNDYYSKFKPVEEAVKVVKSGDTVVYGEFVMVSRYLDKALAQRVPQLAPSLPLLLWPIPRWNT